MIRIALGFRVHTGWAAMVAINGALPHIEVLKRKRIELLPAESGMPRFVYHQASEMDLKAAAAMVKKATELTRRVAMEAVRNVVKELGEVVAVGIPTSSVKPPEDLKAILASHSYIHSAEGQLFRQALIDASDACGLQVVTVKERDLDELRRSVDGMGKKIGPPWSMDQKIATAAALLSLESAGHERSKRTEARAR